GVADCPAHDGLLPAHCTNLGHYFLQKEPVIITQGMMIDEAGAVGVSGVSVPGGGVSTRANRCCSSLAPRPGSAPAGGYAAIVLAPCSMRRSAMAASRSSAEPAFFT